MSEFVKRLTAVALAKETVPGTEAEGTKFWFPRLSGELVPDREWADMNAGFASIDDTSDSAIETRGSSLELEALLSDLNTGLLLLAAFGQEKVCKICTITGASGGTPARGDSISSAGGSWTGKIWKIVTIGVTTYYAIEQLTGTLSAQNDITNGTWTGGTLAIVSGVTGHYYSRAENNAHPSLSAYDYTPAAQHKTTYGMLEAFDLEFARGDYAKAKVNLKARSETATTGLNPSYATENFFLGKHCGTKIAATEAALNAAALVPVSKFALTITKNLLVAQESRMTGVTPGDARAIFNQAFGVSGQITALYGDTTLRGYADGTTKYAVRQEWIQSDAAALATGIYPSLYIDFDRVQFKNWKPEGGLDDIAGQTVDLSPERDPSTGQRVDALLLNSRATAY